MFKIVIDGVHHSTYDDEWVWTNVGSAADAEVRLRWADKKRLSIYPMFYGDFLVVVHSPHGMVVRKIWTEELRQCHADPSYKYYVRDGAPMMIMGHQIQAISLFKFCTI